MACLLNIPILGDAIKKIFSVISDAGFRELGYILSFESNVTQLNSEIVNVKIQEVAVSTLVEIAKNDGEIIHEQVLEWQQDVLKVRTRADEISDLLSGETTSFSCFNFLSFPNLVLGFQLGKEAAQLSKNAAQLTVSGTEIYSINKVGYLQPVENVPTSYTTYHSFASREAAYRKLWEALVDKNGDSILGIYGMPGVGKTRMMEQAGKDAKEKNIFDKVAQVNVGSEKFDVISLQKKLAASLGCNLRSENNKMERASQLSSSLKNGDKKILVILDDVWNDIPLNDVGIPFGDGSSRGCKIMLTSRKQDVCLRNLCNDPIEIKTLTDDEAWEMFQNRVGGIEIAKLNDASLAEKVCKKCAALPLLIDAVANALKCATENLWREALDQLENHRFEEIENIDAQVYAGLKLSFEKLKVEARSCLFFCSMFPEDDYIEIKMLFDLATGSQLLKRERNIYAVIDILRSSSLLLPGRNSDTVKLHDIIRDVARSIAAKDPDYPFLSIRCGLRLPDDVDYCAPKLLQLDLEEDNVQFPDDHLVFPNLHTLWLRGNGQRNQLSCGFFQRFTKLKFLVIQRMGFLDQQQTCINSLKKLRVVIFHDCYIQQRLVSSIPENVKTLCIWKCDLPSTLELPELKGLEKLELFYNSKLIKMVENAISSLSSLEELSVLGNFTIGGDGDVRSLFRELSQLSRFRNLMIDLDTSESYPDQDILNKLVKFSISLGYTGRCSPRNLSKKEIMLEEVDIENGWMGLVKRAETVVLRGIKGLTNGFSNSNMSREANVRELIIMECENMKQLASWAWEGRNQQLLASSSSTTTTAFSNLTVVEIWKCSELEYLFSSTVAKCLPQMQLLHVIGCDRMKEIIKFEAGSTDEGGIICFPKLKDLLLQGLSSLTNFSTQKVRFPIMETMTFSLVSSPFSTEEIELIVLGRDDSPPKLHTLHLQFFSNKVELPSQWLPQLQNIEILDLYLGWWPGDSVFNGTTIFRRLRELEIEGCGYTSLFTFSSLTFLQQLVKLRVSDCPELEEILPGDDEPNHGSNDNKTIISLPRLQSLDLDSLPKLKKRCGLFSCYMPALEKVQIEDCGLSTLFKSSVLTSLQQLSSLEVKDCPLLENIVEDELHDKTPKSTILFLYLQEIEETIMKFEEGSTDEGEIICFPKLKKLLLLGLSSLRNFSTQKVWFPIMETMSIGHVSRRFSTEDIELIVLGRDDSPPKLHTLHLYFPYNYEEVELPSQWLPQLQNIEILDLHRGLSLGDWVFNGSTIFRRLMKLEIGGCGYTSLFTFSSLTFLQQLVKLRLSDCRQLEEILPVDDEPNDDTTIISLPRLQSLELVILPELKKRCGLFSCYMPALERVQVAKCGLSTLFKSSVLTSLQQLSYLEVKDCPLLESIVEDELHDKTPRSTISLLCLKRISLKSLSSLKCFSNSSIYALNMPALRVVEVYDCPRMHTFSLLEVTRTRFFITFRTLVSKYHTTLPKLNVFVREKVYGGGGGGGGEEGGGG